MACVAMPAATAAAVALAWVAFASRPEPRHLLAREDGGVIPLVAVSQPFLTDVQITNFAVEAVTAMTMDFANWREDLSEASGYFEKPGGWRNFLAALETARILDFVRERNFVTTAVANGAVIAGPGSMAAASTAGPSKCR